MTAEQLALIDFCAHLGCTDQATRRGLCFHHYRSLWQRARRHQNPDPTPTRTARRRMAKTPKTAAERVAEMGIDLTGLEDALRDRGNFDWLADAACTGVDYAVLFPEKSNQTGYRDAKAICARCPVRLPCLAENLDEKWGCFGATPGERKTIRVALELRRQDAA
jgi:hypothetical protein